MDPELDTENYKLINNPKARIVVKNLLEEQEYMDAWRILNEEKRIYLEKIIPSQKQAGLDYFFY